MSEYRRHFVPGGTYFFTVGTPRRRPLPTDPRGRGSPRAAIGVVKAKRPFALVGVVLLPAPLPALWTMPAGDAAYSVRWRRLKTEFTERYLAGGGREGACSTSR